MCTDHNLYPIDCVSVGHNCFKPNAVPVNSFCEGVPQFGIQVKILVIEVAVYFLEELLEAMDYDEHFHAYAVQLSAIQQFGLENFDNLKDHIPLQMHSISYEGSQQLLFAICCLSLMIRRIVHVNKLVTRRNFIMFIGSRLLYM
jgi:hypothetical protein